MSVDFHKDIERGILVIKSLLQAHQENKLFNYTKLPEDYIPEEMEKGSKEHLLYLTFVSAIAYLRREERLWTSARETWEEEEKKFLFNPDEILRRPYTEVDHELKEYNLALSKLSVKKWSMGKLKSIDRSKLRENDTDI